VKVYFKSIRIRTAEIITKVTLAGQQCKPWDNSSLFVLLYRQMFEFRLKKRHLALQVLQLLSQGKHIAGAHDHSCVDYTLIKPPNHFFEI